MTLLLCKFQLFTYSCKEKETLLEVSLDFANCSEMRLGPELMNSAMVDAVTIVFDFSYEMCCYHGYNNNIVTIFN